MNKEDISRIKRAVAAGFDHVAGNPGPALDSYERDSSTE